METNPVLTKNTKQPRRGHQLHLGNETDHHQTISPVPMLVLENLSSFLQNCCRDESPQLEPQPSRHPSSFRPPIKWTYLQQNLTSKRPVELLRMKARELIQQERCEGDSSFSVDQPSRLVRIECLKAGCQCVLKQEPALALKVVCGVSLAKGSWSTIQSHAPNRSPIHSAFERLQANRSSQCQTPPEMGSVHHIPLILTSCSPFWFEVLKSQNEKLQGSSMPSWSSGQDLWNARPAIFLLRKRTKCILSVSPSESQSTISLDPNHVVYLHAGTVLRLLDCKQCHLVSKSISPCRPTAPLLQCEIVGSKPLTKYAKAARNLSPDDALYWFTDGARQVYLPLDDGSVSFSSIAQPTPNVRDSRHTDWAHSGAHSILSILANFSLPLKVRPVMDHSLANWLIPSSPCTPNDSMGLHLTSCFHGDLVFLEPITDCSHLATASSNTASGRSSRFFVVTAEMLSQHRFILAEPSSSQMYARELKAHASRVVHFLVAFHPACGLSYLLKYLEDVTHCSSVGPFHRPLTETLGPLGTDDTSISQTTIGSISASSALHLGNDEGRSSGDSHTLYDDLDDIYRYVRTGRLPAKPKIVVSKPSGMLRSCSKAPTPTDRSSCATAALRPRTRLDYTIPYIVFAPESGIQMTKQSSRSHLTTLTHASTSKYPLQSEDHRPQVIPLKSPNRRRQVYIDLGSSRPRERPFRTPLSPQHPPPPPPQAPPSYSILSFAAANERTNSSPDTGLGGDSGQSGSLLVPHAMTSIKQSVCHQSMHFGVNELSGMSDVSKFSRHPYLHLRHLATNVNKHAT